MQTIGIRLAGLGNVGAGVFKHLTQNRALLRERLGLELEVKKIAVRDPKRDRGVAVPAELLTTNAMEFLDDPSIQIIVELTASDIGFARKLGYAIKLLGIIKADADGPIKVRVHPTLVPEKHVLASVNGVFNALAVKADVVGDSLFYGRGAGQDATSSALISDIAEAADALLSLRRNLGFMPQGIYGTCKPIGDIVSEYSLRLSVEDRPGVIAQISGILGESHIGISSILQPEGDEGATVPLVLMIHKASHAQMSGALRLINALACVKKEPRMIRVEHFH